MNIELLIAIGVAVVFGWALNGAYTKWKAAEHTRTLKSVLRGIAWLETYKAPTLTLEQRLKADQDAKLIAALTAAVAGVAKG